MVSHLSVLHPPESFICFRVGSQSVSNKILFQKQFRFADQFCLSSIEGFVMSLWFTWDCHFTNGKLGVSDSRSSFWVNPGALSELIQGHCWIFHRLHPFSVPLVFFHRCKWGLNLAPQFRSYLMILCCKSLKKIHFSPLQMHIQGKRNKKTCGRERKFICNRQN